MKAILIIKGLSLLVKSSVQCKTCSGHWSHYIQIKFTIDSCGANFFKKLLEINFNSQHKFFTPVSIYKCKGNSGKQRSEWKMTVSYFISTNSVPIKCSRDAAAFGLSNNLIRLEGRGKKFEKGICNIIEMRGKGTQNKLIAEWRLNCNKLTKNSGLSFD